MTHVHAWLKDATGVVFLFFTLDRIVEKERCRCGATRFVDWHPRVLM
jgi:hypothetical protein